MSSIAKLTEKVTIPFDPTTIARANDVRRKARPGSRIPSLASVLRDATEIGLKVIESGEPPPEAA